MANTTNIQSDLSVSTPQALNTPESAVPAMGSIRSTNPTSVIQTQRQQDTTTARLVYPADIPKYFLTMDIMSYRRNNLLEIGTTSTITSIALPLPQKLIDTHQVTYDQKPAVAGPAGIFGGTLANKTMDGMRNAGTNMQQAYTSSGFIDAGKSITGSVVNSLSNADKNTVGDLGVAAAAGSAELLGVGGLARSALGYAPNYFLTVILDGPKYKEHNLRWDFSPRSAQESETLNRIIRVLNNSMAPGIAFGGAIFTFPRVFKLYFQPNPRYLYKFKPAVLVAMSIDNSGGGVPSFRREDAATNGKNAPTIVSISMTFLELEFWLRSDFGGDDHGAGTLLPDIVDAYKGGGRDGW